MQIFKNLEKCQNPLKLPVYMKLQLRSIVCYVAMYCHILQGSGYSTEKLRQYQLNRLKYYYAVVECDSAGMKYSNWCTLPIISAHVLKYRANFSI